MLLISSVRFAVRLSVAVACALGMGFCRAEPLRTVAEVRALSAKEMDEQRPVELEGLVVARTFSKGILLQDQTGAFIVEDGKGVVAEPGDMVRIRGITFIDHSQGILQESIRLRQCERMGSGPAPAPKDVDISVFPRGDANFQLVRVKGFVIDAFPDEMDPNWNCLFLRDGDQSLYVAVPNDLGIRERLPQLIDAEVTLTGIGFPHYAAQRMFIGPHLELCSSAAIHIDRPAAADPFSAPLLENIDHASVAEIAALRRRCVVGEVLAAWHGDRFLVREASGRVIRAELFEPHTLPSAGQWVRAVGFPESDVFKINLSAVRWREERGGPLPPLQVEDAVAESILFSSAGERQVKPEYHGRLLRISGVVRSVRRDIPGREELLLDCGRVRVPVDISACPAVADGAEVGSCVEVTGVCVMDIENRRSRTHFPETDGFLVVLRTAGDVRIVARPPWWTPARLLVVILSLVGVLVGFAVWVRVLNRLVERRSRELFKETAARAGADLRVDERTRLAVELHDSISQNLTGASFQIDAAESMMAENPENAAKCLANARVVLGSCRRELRDCISDLRDRTLEEHDAGEALRKALLGRVGTAALSVDFDVPRAKLTDNTFHAIVRIVRELAVNAVRHGRASRIDVRGSMKDGRLVVSVKDDGSGFDPAKRPGMAEGHFGLSGVEERLRRLGGKLKIVSAPGKGTEMEVTIG